MKQSFDTKSYEWMNLMNLDKLNPMQRQAVQTTEGPLLLLAGAGSGKTTVLTNRIAFLVERGVRPFNILAITFTNKAAKEMKERVALMLDDPKDIWISTFHSACVRILRQEIKSLGYESKFTIYDSADSQKLMKQILKEMNLDEKLFPVKTVLNEISLQKNELKGPNEYADVVQNDFRLRKIAEIYTVYQKKLRASNALDFDDLLFQTCQLFTQYPGILEKYQNRFKYIHVDEYQDTNTAQYRMVRLLSRKHKNICVVGDDDQSIYGWRGANIRNILDFEKDFPGAAVLKLEQNYRSTKTILEAANSVIKNNRKRKEKELWTQNETGKKINYYKSDTDLDEAKFVADTIISRKEEGAENKDFSVLYRANSQSRPIEDRLVKQGIPYRIFGGVRFYERAEVKDILAYLKIIYNPLDDISIKRVINVPRRGIGNDTVSKLEAYAAETGLPFIRALSGAAGVFSAASRIAKIKDFVDLIESLSALAASEPVTTIVNSLLERTKYIEELNTGNSQDEAKERAANVMELLTKAAEFESQAEDPSLEAFLEEVALVADIDNFAEGQDAVTLMTMHSAKGLEFKNVFIVGFEEGVFPGSKAAFSSDENGMEEERRVCYVAITRAKENLYISSAVQRRMFDKTAYNAPSRFLKEIPEGLINQVNVPKRPRNIRIEADKSPKASLNYVKQEIKLPPPQFDPPAYNIGDFVIQKKYGRGQVMAVKPAGADYEVTIQFPEAGTKKFMTRLSNIELAN